MLSDSELEQLLNDLESDRVERKESFSDPDRVGQAICAFANDLPNHGLPGVVFIGIRDDGTNAGATVDDRLLLELAGIRDRGNVLPLPQMIVQKRRLQGHDVAVVEVHPAFSPPVRYKGVVWVRTGPRRARASIDEERQLAEKRRFKDLPYDSRPASGAEISDLDLEQFRRVYLPAAVSPDTIAENHRSIEDQLASLHFLTKNGEPTSGGLLAIGRDPRAWIPGAYVQFLRIAGTELTDPILHQEELSGALSDLLPQIDRVLKANISIKTEIPAEGAEQRSPDYPLDALVQLVRNAVLHRTYESSYAPVRIYWFTDRIEIHSPGGPFGQVTAETFGRPGVTDYRNPLVAEAMKSLGFVQRFGFGIMSARKELERNRNPPLEFDVQSSAVLVTLRPRP